MEPRLTNLHITDSKSIAEYGYHEDKNFPVRKSMEDSIWVLRLDYIAVDDFYGDGSGFFGILDGHGGAEVSEYCATALPNVLLT
jgi:serine/threonine protein phosphatase PrpC